jgi:hypothetical protein
VLFKLAEIRVAMRLPFLVCLLLAASVPASLLAAPDSPEDPPLDAARVGWVRIGLEAHKLFIAATTVAEWSVEDTKTVAGRLVESPQGAAIAAGPDLLKVSYDADLPGLHSKTTLWMDPQTGNSLQHEIRESGKRFRERIVRFTDEGAYHRTRRPRPSESASTPTAWTDESSGFWPYNQRLTGTTVLNSLGLLYFIAGSNLAKTGDQLEILVFQKRQLVRVRLTVDGLHEARVAYRAIGDDGSRSCRGSAEALRIRLTVLPYGTARPDFDFLGLKSDIVVYVEPQSRLPLQIEGRAAIIGRVTSTLQEARLKGDVRCPDPI